jgi:hypothetical protein
MFEIGGGGVLREQCAHQKRRRASLAHRSGIRAIGQLTGSAINNMNA